MTARTATVDPAVEAERAQVVRTRGEMTDTIDEIQSRLTPGRLAEQAASNAGEMAADIRDGAVRTLRENPLPAVLLGAGAGLLLFRVFGARSGQSRHHAQPASGGVSPSGVPEAARSAVESAVDGVVGTAATAQDAAQQAAESASLKASAGAGSVNRAIRENPAAAVVVAAGIGAAVGMAVPGTPAEKRTLGPAGGEIVDRAGEAVTEVAERAKRATRRAAGAAQQEMEA